MLRIHRGKEKGGKEREMLKAGGKQSEKKSRTEEMEGKMVDVHRY